MKKFLARSFAGIFEFSSFLYAFWFIVPELPYQPTTLTDSLLFIGAFCTLFLVGFFIGAHINPYISLDDLDSLRLSFLAGHVLFIGISLTQDSPIILGICAVGIILLYIVWSVNKGMSDYRTGNKPYQKYDWVPRKTYQLPMVPYYAWKHYQEHGNLFEKQSS
jgi:hypothetical protein